MKDQFGWEQTVHLLCRWHIYEAIKRHVSSIFKKGIEKGKQHEELLRFIDSFRSVVCAHTEEEMRSAWDTLEQEGQFPSEAVGWLKKQYYDSPKAHQFMECYVYNCGNMSQTSTSRNEGSHAAYRSKASVISKPAESYQLRRIHKTQWMQRLRVNAMQARARIPLDLRNSPELSQLVGTLSIFALTQINKEILRAKHDRLDGVQLALPLTCTCHTHRRYGLPCKHVVPTDGSAIELEQISPFWRLDNWDQGYPFQVAGKSVLIDRSNRSRKSTSTPTDFRIIQYCRSFSR